MLYYGIFSIGCKRIERGIDDGNRLFIFGNRDSGIRVFYWDGLKNFKNPNAKNLMEYLDDDGDEHELMNENEVHHFMGISKEDAKALIGEQPSIPHIKINDTVYYPKAKLRAWLLKLGE